MRVYRKGVAAAAFLTVVLTAASIASGFPGHVDAFATALHQKSIRLSVTEQRDLGVLNPMFAEPDLSQNDMVWVGDEPATRLRNPNAVFLTNVVTGKSALVATTSFAQNSVITDPQVNNQWITWLDQGWDATGRPIYRLFVRDRLTGKKKVLVSFSAALGKNFFMGNDVLRGNRLLFAQPFGTHAARIQLADLQSGKIETVTTTGAQFAPNLSWYGDVVTWESSIGLAGTVNVLRLSTHALKRFPVGGDFAYPKVFGRYVVYSPEKFNKRNGQLINQRNVLQVRDMTTGAAISTSARSAYFWSIGDGFFTWSDYSNNKASSVFLEAVSGHSERVLLGTGLSLPYAFGNRLIWVAQNRHVHLGTVTLSNLGGQ